MQRPTRQRQKWVDVRKPKKNSSLVQEESQYFIPIGLFLWGNLGVCPNCRNMFKKIPSIYRGRCNSKPWQAASSQDWIPTVEQPPSIHPSIIKHVPKTGQNMQTVSCLSVGEKSRGDLPYHTALFTEIISPSHIHQAFPILDSSIPACWLALVPWELWLPRSSRDCHLFVVNWYPMRPMITCWA